MKLLKVDKLLIFWTIFVLLVIVLPFSPDSAVSQIMGEVDYSDKIAHFILFGIFAWLLNDSLQSRNIKNFSAYVLSFLGTSVYAGLAELIQSYIPSRDMSLSDFLAGTIGAIVALSVIYVRDKRK